MNTEKEQKVLEYLEKKEAEQIITELEKQEYTKEKLVKDIEEFNSVVSGLTRDDLSPETAKRLVKVFYTKIKTPRRIFVLNGINSEELPEIETILGM